MSRDPANMFPVRGGVVHAALACGWDLKGLAHVRVALDRVGEIKIAPCIKDQIVGSAELHSITGSVEPSDVPLRINAFDATSLIIRRGADRHSLVPGKATVVGDIERAIRTAGRTVGPATWAGEY